MNNEPALVEISADGAMYVIKTDYELYCIPVHNGLRADPDGAMLTSIPSDGSERPVEYDFGSPDCAHDVFQQIMSLSARTASQKPERKGGFGSAGRVFVVAGSICAFFLAVFGMSLFLSHLASQVTGPQHENGGGSVMTSNPTKTTANADADNPTRPLRIPAHLAVTPPTPPAAPQHNGSSSDQAPQKMKVVPGDSRLPHSFAIQRVEQK